MFSCCDCYTAEELLEAIRMYQEENDWVESLILSWEYEPIAPSVIQAIEEAGYFCETHFGVGHEIIYYKCYFISVPEKQRVCNQQRIKEREERKKKDSQGVSFEIIFYTIVVAIQIGILIFMWSQ